MKKALILSLVLFLSGCAAAANKKMMEQMTERMNEAIGVKTKEDFVQKMGIPTREEKVGDLEVWEYRNSLGVRGRSSTFYNQFNAGTDTNGIANSNIRVHESYEVMVLTFDIDGKLKSWSYRRQ
jgi:hypothetical protein